MSSGDLELKAVTGPVKLSVVTPVRQGRDYIGNCIESVAAQGVAGIEQIVVDGASEDGTAAEALRLAARYSHVLVLSEPDLGQSDALNKGIKLARGAIIGILNADDEYEPGALSDVLRRFESLPEPSLLVGNCNVWGPDGELRFIGVPERLAFRALVLNPEPSTFPVNPASYFYHRSLHGAIGWYDAAEDLGMDLDFLLRVCRVANIQYVNRVYGNFRMHARTKTFKAREQGLLKRRVSQIVQRHLQRLPFPERVLLRAGRAVFSIRHRLRALAS